MSWKKKLGKQASDFGKKSSDFIEVTKLKGKRSELKEKKEEKLLDLGKIVYKAGREGQEPEKGLFDQYFDEIAKLESEIEEINSEINKNES